MAKIQLGFIGAGSMGQCAHLRNYVNQSECDVVALAELRPELGKKVAERYGIPKVYKDHRDLLANENLDAVVAIMPYSSHGQLIPDLILLDIPILIEKPLARSIEAGAAILTALNRSESKLYLGYHKRSDPATIFARNQIAAWKQSGEMGAMKYIRATMPPGSWEASGFSHLVKTDEQYPPLAQDPAPMNMSELTAKALDVFVNYYIHQVNLIRHLLGENYAINYADPSGVVLVGHGASGIPVTLEMQPYRTTLDWQESFLVTFERGWIKLELPAPLTIDRPGKVQVFMDSGGGSAPITIEPQLPWIHAMRQQAIHFVNAIKGEQTPLCQADEALLDLEIAYQYMGKLITRNGK